MNQLIFDFASHDYPGFDKFLGTENAELVYVLQHKHGQFIYVWGEEGAGKSHLLQAWVAQALDAGGIDAIEVSGGTPASGDRVPVRTKIERQEQEAQAPDMPAAFEARAGAMWREAYTLAQAHFAAERKGWEGQVKAAQSEAVQLAADLDEVETQRDEAQRAAAEDAQRVDELRGRLERIEGQAEDRKAELERLRDELRELRARLDQERTRADRAPLRGGARAPGRACGSGSGRARAGRPHGSGSRR